MLARGSALSPSCSASTNAAANVQLLLIMRCSSRMTREHVVERGLRFRERALQRLLDGALHVFANFRVVEMDAADGVGASGGERSREPQHRIVKVVPVGVLARDRRFAGRHADVGLAGGE